MEDMNEPSGDIGSTFRLSLDNPTAHFSTCSCFTDRPKIEIEGDDV